ncbi:MAG TPA: MBL fold metallo-hydrolase [bacterium]|nr:MBL fold metallo-hydrolase [bacterium]
MPALHETRIQDNLFVWTIGGDTIETSYGANCIGVIGTDAVLLVDPLIAPAHARLVDEALKDLTRAPVRFVVLTHHHTDHALGSSYFAARDAVVFSHRACREAMAEEHPGIIQQRRARPELRELFADAESVLPSVTFDEGLVLHVGGIEIEVWHPGWGHTPGDAFLFIPALGVAISGDLVFSGYHYNYEQASIAGARKGLQALASLDAETFIPGHGAPGGPGALDAQSRYHDAVEDIVSRGLSAGWEETLITAEIARSFPDHLMSIVIPSGIKQIKAHLAKAK